MAVILPLSFSQVTLLVVQPLMSLFGIIANVICLAVLRGPQYRNSTAVYLQSIALASLLIIIIQQLEISKADPASMEDTKFKAIFAPYTIYFRYPIGNILSICTSFIVVSVAFERCLVVTFPIAARNFCRRRTAWLTCVACLLASILLNIPRFLQYTPVIDVNVSTYVNQNFDSNGSLIIPQAYNVIISVVGSVIPFILIFIANLCLLFAMSRHWRRSEQLTESIDVSRQASNSREKRTLTLMVFTTTIIFSLCESVSIYNFFVITFFGERGGVVHLRQYNLIVLGNAFTLADSCFCTSLYLALSRRYRKSVAGLCCGKLLKNQNQRNDYSTTSHASQGDAFKKIQNSSQTLRISSQ